MKIVLLTEGGENIGLGHVSRCLSLVQEFERRGLQPDFMINGDHVVRRFLGTVTYNLLDWINDKEKLFRDLSGADVVIIDSYLADRYLYEDIAEKSPDALIVSIDDDNRLEYPLGIVINPSLYGEKLAYSQGNRRMLWTGKDYIILRESFKEVPPKEIHREIKNILITFGGSGHAALMHQIVDTLNEHYHVSVVDPSQKPSTGEEMVAAMRQADICISGGGQTLCELSRMGVPTIAICFGDNQLPGISTWQDIGFIKFAGHWKDDRLLEHIRDAIAELNPVEQRLRSSRIGRTQVDGKGAERIVDRIITQRQRNDIPSGAEGISLRKVCDCDCEDLWKWRNDLRVRAVSFDNREIAFEDHVRWFHQKCADQKSVIFIAENDRQVKLGQVRFEKGEDHHATIHINLNPDFIGKGYGSRIIRLASQTFLEQNLDVRAIIAEVMADNAASQNAFDLAGYAMGPQEMIKNGQKMLIYHFSQMSQQKVCGTS